MKGGLPGGLKELVLLDAINGPGEQARTRSVVDKLIELVAVTRISVAMRPNYGAFAESVRRLFQ